LKDFVLKQEHLEIFNNLPNYPVLRVKQSSTIVIKDDFFMQKLSDFVFNLIKVHIFSSITVKEILNYASLSVKGFEQITSIDIINLINTKLNQLLDVYSEDGIARVVIKGCRYDKIEEEIEKT